jgi:hypothetical protein
MTIERGDFDSIMEQDLQEIVEAQVTEGLRLDFKLTEYGKSDSDKRELLKDISALANSHGGHLVLGIEETEGIAKKLVGVAIDADAEILRMELIARNGLEPPIPGIRIRAIPLATGQKVLLVRVPRSWNPPHRVKAQGINRFYIRHSAGVHEPSIEELRALFNQSASALEQARRFRDERLHLVTEGRGQRPLEGGGRFFLHIVPLSAFSGMVHLDVEQVSAKKAAFWPLGASGMTPRFNYYGFINERGGDKNCGYTQIFRNGALEATKAGIVYEHNGHLIISGAGLEKNIFMHFSTYIMGLRDVGVPPPLIIMFTFEGVLGARYVVNVVRSELFGYGPPLPESVLALPECVLEDYGTEIDHHRAVRPAFDALWNAIGYSKSQSFNEEGLWDGGMNQR